MESSSSIFWHNDLSIIDSINDNLLKGCSQHRLLTPHCVWVNVTCLTPVGMLLPDDVPASATLQYLSPVAPAAANYNRVITRHRYIIAKHWSFTSDDTIVCMILFDLRVDSEKVTYNSIPVHNFCTTNWSQIKGSICQVYTVDTHAKCDFWILQFSQCQFHIDVTKLINCQLNDRLLLAEMFCTVTTRILMWFALAVCEFGLYKGLTWMFCVLWNTT